jgi:hypothetical protein
MALSQGNAITAQLAAKAMIKRKKGGRIIKACVKSSPASSQ